MLNTVVEKQVWESLCFPFAILDFSEPLSVQIGTASVRVVGLPCRLAHPDGPVVLRHQRHQMQNDKRGLKPNVEEGKVSYSLN